MGATGWVVGEVSPKEEAFEPRPGPKEGSSYKEIRGESAPGGENIAPRPRWGQARCTTAQVGKAGGSKQARLWEVRSSSFLILVYQGPVLDKTQKKAQQAGGPL